MGQRTRSRAKTGVLAVVATLALACGTPTPSPTELRTAPATRSPGTSAPVADVTAPEPTPTCPPRASASIMPRTAKNMASASEIIAVGAIRSLGIPRRYDTSYLQIVLTPAVVDVSRTLKGPVREGELDVQVSARDPICPDPDGAPPTVEAGGRYVFFISRSDSYVRGLAGVPIVSAAWPIDADDVITTAINGRMTLTAFTSLLPRASATP